VSYSVDFFGYCCSVNYSVDYFGYSGYSAGVVHCFVKCSAGQPIFAQCFGCFAE
jgi:hypothetical protein